MKLATWNVNSLKVRLPHLTDWLAQARPDIVCLQELKTEDAKFPRHELQAAGFQSVFSGQKTYNGVAILSRAPLLEVSTGLPRFPDEQKRVIAATAAGVRVICVYCPNGGEDEKAKSLSIDAAGNIYILAYIGPPDGCSDFLILKYNSSGVRQGAPSRWKLQRCAARDESRCGWECVLLVPELA